MISIPAWLKSKGQQKSDDTREQLSSIHRAIKEETQKIERALQARSANKVKD